MDDIQPNNSLWGAAIRGERDRVEEILSDPEGMAQINQLNEYGYTPLQAAVPCDTATLQILLENGANPNVQAPPADPSGRTPLHDVLHHGAEENAMLLIQYGANVTIRDAWGNTPLHLAVKNSSLQVLLAMGNTGQLQPQHYQEQNNEGKSPLDIAQERQSNEIIDFINTHAEEPAPAP